MTAPPYDRLVPWSVRDSLSMVEVGVLWAAPGHGIWIGDRGRYVELVPDHEIDSYRACHRLGELTVTPKEKNMITADDPSTRSSTLAEEAAGRHPGTAHFAPLFDHEHLLEHLGEIAGPAADLARHMLRELPDGPELSAGLRKLLEAKDCFVRARVLDAATDRSGLADRTDEETARSALRGARALGRR